TGALASALCRGSRRVPAVPIAGPGNLESLSARALAADRADAAPAISMRRRHIMMRLKWNVTMAVFAALLSGSPCLAQSVTPEGIAERFADAWNTHDRAAFDRLFADDAHFIPTYDLVAEGRTDVVAGIYQGH